MIKKELQGVDEETKNDNGEINDETKNKKTKNEESRDPGDETKK